MRSVRLVLLVSAFALGVFLFGTESSSPPLGGVADADNRPGEIEAQQPCSKCTESRCGCAANTAGCSLTASCTCTHTECSVTCTYKCD